MVFVPDANTLSYLAKADLLHILDPYPVVVGDRVFEESVVRGREEQRADAFILERHIEKTFERRRSPDAKQLDEALAYFGGAGEAEASALAEQADGTVITSDRAAYRKMRRRGVKAVRTDMFLFRQFQEGRLERALLHDHLMRLRAAGGTTDQRIQFFMKEMEKMREGSHE